MSDIVSKPRPVGEFGRCLIGPTIWAAHLTILYGAHTLICARMAGATGRMVWAFFVPTVTALALLGLVGLVVQQLWLHPPPGQEEARSGASFLRYIALLLSVLSGLGIIWGILPAALLPICH